MGQREDVQMVGLLQQIAALLQDMSIASQVMEAKPEPVKAKEKVERLTSGCKDHPNYSGQRKPRSECPHCWESYDEKNKGKAK